MKGIKSVFIKMQRINTVIISLALLAMVGVVFLQTFCRFVIFRSLSWSEELSRYLFVTLIVLGVNLAITNHLFVRIEIIDNYLKGTAAVMMNLIRKFIMIYVNIDSNWGLPDQPGYEDSHEPSLRYCIHWLCHECICQSD